MILMPIEPLGLGGICARIILIPKGDPCFCGVVWNLHPNPG